jgi:hypothetical protein
MGRSLGVLVLIATTAMACSTGPQVLRPNEATEFRIDVTFRPVETRASECESEPSPGSRSCRVRFSAKITNVGQEAADAICFVSFADAEGRPVSGGDLILGTLEPGQSVNRSGTMGFRRQLGGLGESRCSSYPPGSTTDIG